MTRNQWLWPDSPLGKSVPLLQGFPSLMFLSLSMFWTLWQSVTFLRDCCSTEILWQKSSSGAIKILAESKKLTGAPSTSLGGHSAESQETNNLVQAPLTAVTKLGFIIEFRSQTILGSQGESKFPALQQNYSGKWIQSYLSLWAQKTNFGDLEVSVVDAT